MKYLFIDTSLPYINVSIIKDNIILSSYSNKIISDMSSKIMIIIDDCFKESKLNINDIDKIFIVSGPGSFTGVRIGVTIAKTIAWSLNKSVVPISSLEFLATTKSLKKYLVPIIDARRGNVYAGIYDSNLDPIMNDTMINLDDLLSKINDDYELISFDEIKGSTIPKPNVLNIIEKHKFDESVNPHKLIPKYLKLTEAEENKCKDD